MFYSFDPEKMKSTFSVPTDIVDKLLKFTDFERLKVLLYLLRFNGKEIDIEAMSKAINIEIEAINNCIQYYEYNGFFKEVNSAEPIKFVPATTEKVKLEEPPAVISKPSSEEIAQRIEESPEIGHLMVEAQRKLGKTIGYDGQCTLLLLHDHYGLPIEVLFMLIEYCVSVNKTNYSYIEAVGKDWGIKEIDTLEKAAMQISSLNNANQLWTEFAKYAGLNTPRPTLKQAEFLHRWRDEWKFSNEMIFRAYDEMATYTGKLNFKYIDKVLNSWYNEGYKSTSQVDEGQKKHIETKKNEEKKSASYDIAEFINRSIHGELKYERKKKE